VIGKSEGERFVPIAGRRRPEYLFCHDFQTLIFKQLISKQLISEY
jgi:hypothetical protein